MTDLEKQLRELNKCMKKEESLETANKIQELLKLGLITQETVNINKELLSKYKDMGYTLGINQNPMNKTYTITASMITNQNHRIGFIVADNIKKEQFLK